MTCNYYTLLVALSRLVPAAIISAYRRTGESSTSIHVQAVDNNSLLFYIVTSSSAI